MRCIGSRKGLGSEMEEILGVDFSVTPRSLWRTYRDTSSTDSDMDMRQNIKMKYIS